jgi:hypothetical protein
MEPSTTAYAPWQVDKGKSILLSVHGLVLTPDNNTGIDPSFSQHEAVAAAMQSTADAVKGSQSPERNRQGRVLSQTKRAQQNRAAQRAFRQRKDLYIKELEAKAEQLKNMQAQIDELKHENGELRNYILALQSRVLNQPGSPTPPSVPTAIYRGNDDLQYGKGPAPGSKRDNP